MLAFTLLATLKLKHLIDNEIRGKIAYFRDLEKSGWGWELLSARGI